jgi:hypothetical protein
LPVLIVQDANINRVGQAAGIFSRCFTNIWERRTNGMQGTHADYVKFLASLLIFGTNGLLVTHIHLASTQIVFTRTLLGSVFLLLVACW